MGFGFDIRHMGLPDFCGRVRRGFEVRKAFNSR